MQDLDIAEWRYATVRGKIVGCLRGKEAVEPVAKYLKTLLKKDKIRSDRLNEVLNEVEQQSVQSFLGDPRFQGERRRRFQDLVRTLDLARKEDQNG